MRSIRLLYTVILLGNLLVQTQAYALDLSGGLSIPFTDDWKEDTSAEQSEYLLYKGSSSAMDLEVSVITNRNLQTNLTNNYSSLSDDELAQLAEEAVQTSTDNDSIELDDYKLIKGKQLTFLRFDGEYKNTEDTESISGDHFTQYVTVANGGSLQINFYKDGTALSNEEKEVLESTIIQNVQYEELTPRSVDQHIILKLGGIALVVFLLIGSVALHIWYRRKKMRKIA